MFLSRKSHGVHRGVRRMMVTAPQRRPFFDGQNSEWIELSSRYARFRLGFPQPHQTSQRYSQASRLRLARGVSVQRLLQHCYRTHLKSSQCRYGFLCVNLPTKMACSLPSLKHDCSTEVISFCCNHAHTQALSANEFRSNTCLLLLFCV